MDDDTVLGNDICPFNIIANALAEELGLEYDKDGENAQKGTLINALLEDLNSIRYYPKEGPKSLGSDMINKVVKPILTKHDISIHDKLRTFYEHAAIQISNAISKLNEKGIAKNTNGKMLVTGGGAFNEFFVSRLKKLSSADIEIPDEQLVKFKEALITAFVGVLRIRGEATCLSSVTGATKDTIGGAVYQSSNKNHLSQKLI